MCRSFRLRIGLLPRETLGCSLSKMLSIQSLQGRSRFQPNQIRSTWQKVTGPLNQKYFLFSVDCFYVCKITLYCFKLTIEFERNIINKVKVNNNKCLQSFLITIFNLILCKEKLKTYKYFKHFRLHWIDLSVTLSINILKIWKNQINILRQM